MSLMLKNLTKKTLCFTLLFTSLRAISADTAVIHMMTVASPTARYEIISSTLAARHTFRLDRFCGEISQIVKTQSDELTWQGMWVSGLPKCQTDNKPRYQLFTSGMAARNTFLMNTDTGKTWQIMTFKDKDGNEDSGWFPIN